MKTFGILYEDEHKFFQTEYSLSAYGIKGSILWEQKIYTYKGNVVYGIQEIMLNNDIFIYNTYSDIYNLPSNWAIL